MTDTELFCRLLNPNVDWSKVDLSHVANLKLTLNPTRRDKLIEAVQSTYWPEAVPGQMIVKSSEERQRRSKSIIHDFIRQPVRGQRVLDLGCGAGDCTTTAFEQGAVAIGYDAVPHADWTTQKGEFTTDLEVVKEKGPYDIVLMYDVYDHRSREYSIEPILQLLPKITTPKALIYARVHPFSSRHGGHLYETLNKAYVHLFLTPPEIEKLGGKLDTYSRIIHPEVVYPATWGKLGFPIVSQKSSIVVPEPIIETFLPFVAPLWHQQCKITDFSQILHIMSIQFIDYVLRPNT